MNIDQINAYFQAQLKETEMAVYESARRTMEHCTKDMDAISKQNVAGLIADWSWRKRII